MKLLAKTVDSIPFIFLITDGAVEDEREICNIMKGYLTSGGSIHPRISTFGIGKGFVPFFFMAKKGFCSFSCLGFRVLFL